MGVFEEDADILQDVIQAKELILSIDLNLRLLEAVR